GSGRRGGRRAPLLLGERRGERQYGQRGDRQRQPSPPAEQNDRERQNERHQRRRDIEKQARGETVFAQHPAETPKYTRQSGGDHQDDPHRFSSRRTGEYGGSEGSLHAFRRMDGRGGRIGKESLLGEADEPIDL